MSDKIDFEVGNARRVSFWKDNWYGDKALCVFSPPSFALTSSKEEQVVDIWGCTIEGGGWNPIFSRPFNDWKVDIVDLKNPTKEGTPRLGR